MDLNDRATRFRQDFIDGVLEELDIMSESLQSPLERAFLWAFCCDRQHVKGCGWLPPIGVPGANESGAMCAVLAEHGTGDVELLSQVPVVISGNAYRLDFVLVIRSPGGARVWVDIELDGHDFHERTKEQAEHDKKRDRDVQSAGYHVARFTGSQVYRNPRAVVQESIDFAVGLLRRSEGT